MFSGVAPIHVVILASAAFLVALATPINYACNEMDNLSSAASLIQADTFLKSGTLQGVDRSKILAWDTILAMDVNTEKDEVKKMGKTLQKETSVARALTNEISDLNMLL